MSRTLQVEHLGRVEGHGAFTVVLDGPDVVRVEFRVFEGLRLFERLLLGHRFDEVPAIVSRVCSICSHAHAITAVQALEDALGVPPTPRAVRLRELALHGGNIESHALHAFALALPDFLYLQGLSELARKHPEDTLLALRLKKLGNTIQEVVGGRAIHPVTYVAGGFTAEPTAETRACVDAWTAGTGLVKCLGRLYAIESGQPAISRTKREGLISRYGVGDGSGTAYFRVHETRDVEHAAETRALIAELAGRADEDAIVAAAESAFRANWRLLDGV